MYRKLFFAAACTIASPAAANITGNFLHTACSSENAEQQAFCSGYILGIFEGVKWGATVIAKGAITEMTAEDTNRFTGLMLGYCHQEGVEYGQYVDIVVKYLSDNPAKRHFTARTLAHDAWREAFPCADGMFDDLIPNAPE